MRKVLVLVGLMGLVGLGSCSSTPGCRRPCWEGTCPDVRTDPRPCRSAQEAAACCGGGLPVCR